MFIRWAWHERSKVFQLQFPHLLVLKSQVHRAHSNRSAVIGAGVRKEHGRSARSSGSLQGVVKSRFDSHSAAPAPAPICDRMASAKEARLRVMTLNVCLPPPFCRNRDLPTLVSVNFSPATRHDRSDAAPHWISGGTVPTVLSGCSQLGAGSALRLHPRCPHDWRNRRAAGVADRVRARFHSRRANLRG